MRLRVFIVIGFLVCCLCSGVSFAQNKVVVIPLFEDGRTCSGTLVGTRWCDNGNQTVTDMTTGLVWLKYASWGGTKPWRSSAGYDDAHTRAGILRNGEVVNVGIGGYEFILNDGSVEGDWRLPKKTELNNLANGLEAVRIYNMRAFKGVQSFYWSSSTVVGDISNALRMNMLNSFVSSYNKSNDVYVWPVRSGN